MKTNLAIASAILFLLPSLWGIDALRAQEYGSFMEEAGLSSVLYRGRVALRYPFAFNGTVYWSGPEFKTGSLVFNSKRYEGVLLNVNANLHEVQVRWSASSPAVALSPSMVESLSFDSMVFENMYSNPVPGIPQGYYQLLYKGRNHTLYKRVDRNYSDGIDAVDRFLYEHPDANPKVRRIFEPKYSFYIVTDGKGTLVKGAAALRRYFKPLKSRFRAFLFDGNFNKDDDAMYVGVLQIVDEYEK